MEDINVMKHRLVPEHRLVPVEKEEEILSGLHVSKDKLPKVLRSDPVLSQLEAIEGDIKEGRIIEIIRESKTAGKAKVYRLVVDR